MKSLLAAIAVAALSFGFSGIANATPAVGGLDGIHAGSNLVQKTGYYHHHHYYHHYRHRHCVWRHHHRHCWWN